MKPIENILINQYFICNHKKSSISVNNPPKEPLIRIKVNLRHLKPIINLSQTNRTTFLLLVQMCLRIINQVVINQIIIRLIKRIKAIKR